MKFEKMTKNQKHYMGTVKWDILINPVNKAFIDQMRGLHDLLYPSRTV